MGMFLLRIPAFRRPLLTQQESARDVCLAPGAPAGAQLPALECGCSWRCICLLHACNCCSHGLFLSGSSPPGHAYQSRSPCQVLVVIRALRDTLFPENWSPPPPRTTEQKEEALRDARKRLASSVPAVLSSLLGADTSRNGILKVRAWVWVWVWVWVCVGVCALVHPPSPDPDDCRSSTRCNVATPTSISSTCCWS